MLFFVTFPTWRLVCAMLKAETPRASLGRVDSLWVIT